MTSTARSRGPDRREQIAVVALRLFVEKGYDATSMREIAEQLAMTKAALYYHYESKEDIVRGLVEGMLDQVDELVAWARQQQLTDGVRREILARWGDIMLSQGLAMFRFAMYNQRVIEDVRGDPQGLAANLDELGVMLVPAGAGVEDQLRARMALLAINMAGFAGLEMDATDHEIFEAARRVAAELLPSNADS